MGNAKPVSELAGVFSSTYAQFEQVSSWAWDPMGQALVILTSPRPGERVLDACCGAGASAIPAAHAAAPGGHVDAVDIASGLLGLGRQKAAAQRVTTVDFVESDVTTWYPERPYDVVQCAYGVFFLPDMDASAKRLIGLLRQGGRFGVSAWWRPALEDFGKAWADATDAFRPAQGEKADLPSQVQSASRRIATPETLRAWLESLGLRDIAVHPLKQTVPLSPDRAWDFVLGSGFRGALAEFSPETVLAIRESFLSLLAEREVTHIDISTVIACGTRG